MKSSCLTSTAFLVLALSTLFPRSAAPSPLRDRDVSLLRPGWFWSAVPAGHSDLLEDHARINWYAPSMPVREVDLDPSLMAEEGSHDVRPAMELSIRPPAIDTSAVTMDSSDWAGIVQELSVTGLDVSGLRAVELWLNDFHRDHTTTHATLRLAYGEFSEDAFWDLDHPPNAKLDTEDKNQDGRLDRRDPEDFSYAIQDEDTGLDGLHDSEEPGYTGLGSDPNQDDYRFDFNSGDYSTINNTEGNAVVDPSARPDTEDLNRNGVLDLDEDYREVSIDLSDSAFVAIDVPRDYVIQDAQNGWRLFRIPVESFQAVGSPGMVAHAIRLVLEGLSEPARLQIGGIRLVGVPAPPGVHVLLNQNRPNPFNPSTAITYELPRSLRARLEIYDVAGRRIATLFDEVQDAGPHRTLWSGRDDAGRPVPSGVYLYRLWTPGGETSRRMVLLK